MKGKIAVIGALTNFGRSLLDELARSGWPARDIVALDHTKNHTQIPYQDDLLPVLSLETFRFHGIGLGFLCLPTLLSDDKDTILQSGAYLVDCVGILEDSLCVVASLNLKKCSKSRVILNPTALCITLAGALSPIHKHFSVKEATSTILLSAGLFGSAAIRDLIDQSRCLFTREEPQMSFFSQIQAFNLIPDISPALNRKTADQIKSLLHFPIAISSCLTPVFQGECYSVTFTTRKKTSLNEIRKVCEKNCLLDEPFAADLGLSAQDVLVGDSACISRLSIVPFRPNTYHLWILCDSLRTGAIPNAIKIARHLLS